MYDKKFLNLFKINETEQDKHFQNYFLEIAIFQELLDNQTNIVYGTKGSGKSALMTALTEINRENYINTYCINLKNLSFNTFYKYISDFKDYTDIELDNVTNAVWKKTFVFYCLYVIYTSDHISINISKRIEKIFQNYTLEKELNIADISEGGTAPINAIQHLFQAFVSFPKDRSFKS
jgi:energy-coupling factor transporter ATP-binding protein EcfA2